MVNKLTYALVMAMDEKTFHAEATSNAEKRAWLKEALTRTEIRKTYPRIPVFNEEKGKIVYVADKTQKAKVSSVAISFFGLKKAYCEEVLKLEKKANEKKITFRERMLNI